MTALTALFDRHPVSSATTARAAPPITTPRLTPELMDFYKQEARRLRAEALRHAMLRTGAAIAAAWRAIRRTG